MPDITMKLVNRPEDADLIFVDDYSNADMHICRKNDFLSQKVIKVSEFMKEFEALLQAKGLTHYWTYPRSPKMNAHNERFNRTIQEQFVDYYEDLLFTDMELFNQKMADWLIDYNTIIPHHSLDMKNPVQYLIENHQECHMLWTNPLF